MPRGTLTGQHPLQSAPQAQMTDASSVLVRLQRLLRPARLRGAHWHSRPTVAAQLAGGHPAGGSRRLSALSQAAGAAGVDEPVRQLQQAATTTPQEPATEAAYLAPLSEEQRAAVTAPVDVHVRCPAQQASCRSVSSAVLAEGYLVPKAWISRTCAASPSMIPPSDSHDGVV